MGQKKRRNKKKKPGKSGPKAWHVWSRATVFHKDKKRYNRTKKHKEGEDNGQTE